MKYKTTIQIVTEAENKDEAMEIAGEYLAGNLKSGVDMRCRTAKVDAHRAIIAASSIAALLIVSSLLIGLNLKIQPTTIYTISGVSAIQPPLKTSSGKFNADFKKEWKVKETKKALELILE